MQKETCRSIQTPSTSSSGIGVLMRLRCRSTPRSKILKVLTAPYKVPAQTLRLAPFDQIMELNCTNVETAGLMDAAAKQGYGR